MKHQHMEGQPKRQQQEDEKDEDAHEGSYNFSKHYNINTKALKPVRKKQTNKETHFNTLTQESILSTRKNPSQVGIPSICLISQYIYPC